MKSANEFSTALVRNNKVFNLAVPDHDLWKSDVLMFYA